MPLKKENLLFQCPCEWPNMILVGQKPFIHPFKKIKRERYIGYEKRVQHTDLRAYWRDICWSDSENAVKSSSPCQTTSNGKDYANICLSIRLNLFSLLDLAYTEQLKVGTYSEHSHVVCTSQARVSLVTTIVRLSTVMSTRRLYLVFTRLWLLT